MVSRLAGPPGVLAAVIAAAFFLLVPNLAQACACGCGIFGVGASSLFPNGAGDVVYFQDSYMNQGRNWSGGAKSASDNNDDKKITTNFADFGWQHMFDRKWGLTIELQIASRSFATNVAPGVAQTFNHTSLGDLRITGMYTGFSPDMSTGLILGAKLPTGDWKYANYDRDTQIGTGSTDLLLGGYHLGGFGAKSPYGWFAQVLWDKPLASQGGYRPGAEVDGALGVYRQGWQVATHVKLTPVLQLLASSRGRDQGSDANPSDSGYDRLLVSPGLELEVKSWRAYADVELPVYQRVNGNQLIAPQLFKVVLSRSF